MQDGLLTIGRFARLCRLSVKQLRHYDEMGLLAPARVDAGSGYRYYAYAHRALRQLPLAYNALFAAVHERGLRP
ncbi:DNA-binding transcriptional MerR regulator [Streptomyces sp. V4I23]|uniref:MerR family DNA-binding transcriptional regulator n=1 Tax=Streptomyces sp. V4I23 TaxID=3042282 RepID=UPI002786AAB3|nr:DNA-binding transcriptional MerR regulator [Streptomyces sp. V4I23]